MGQNHFSLMGELCVETGAKPDQIEIDGFVVPGIRAIIQSGPDYANERMQVYVTGEAAQIVYEWLLKTSQKKIHVFLQGSLKAYGGIIWPVATYVRVYEQSKTGKLASEMTRPDKLARLIQSNMTPEQIRGLIQNLSSGLQK